MTAAVEKMAYAGDTPWHGLGTKVADTLSPAQMLKAASLNWTVSKRELHFVQANGKDAKVPDKYALVRDTDETVLTTVGSTYKPVQNADAMDFFKKFVTAGKMKMETAGALWGGRYVWGLARVGADFALSKSDKIENFLLMASPHVHGKAMVFQFTPIRVVCWNTLTFALGSSLKGTKNAFRMPHSVAFDDKVKDAAEQSLGIAKQQIDEFKEAATLLSKKKAKTSDVEEFFCEVLRFDPKDNEQREPRALSKLREALTHAPGQALNTAAGTWWGAVNAVTYVYDHETGRERDTALKNAWLGHTANIKRRAFDLALKRAMP